MQSMSLNERQEYVERQATERKRIQKQINELNGQRNAYIAQESKNAAEQSGRKTLDQALVEAIRVQASAKAFRFGDGAQ